MRVIATAGHVDHGKSTLLRALTGMEPDRWAEERQRGLTIDLGYVWMTLPDPAGASAIDVAFVDVPGHEGFVANMLAGIGVVEDVLLVVAADGGWSAQTEEHHDIVRLLDRRIVAVVLTRCDVATESRRAEVRADVALRLEASGSLGVPIVEVSAPTGDGLDILRQILVERLAVADDDAAVRSGPSVRLEIDRVFTVRGTGLVATGMLRSGTISSGDELVVLPSGAVGRVRGIQQLGAPVDVATAPARVAVDLVRIGSEDIERGSVLIPSEGRHASPGTSLLDVELRALPGRTVGRTGAWHLHLGTAFTTATVVPVLGDLAPGATGTCRLQLDRPLAAWAGDHFVLRDAGRRITAAGGVVLDPRPSRSFRGQERRLVHAVALEAIAEAADDSERALALAEAHGGVLGRDTLIDVLGRLPPRTPGLTSLGEVLVVEARVTEWREAVVEAALTSSPDHAADAADLARAARRVGCPQHLVRGVLEDAVERGILRSVGGRYLHRDHWDAYRSARSARQQVLLDLLDEDPLEPPDPGELTGIATIPSFEVQELLDDGRLVACGPLLFTRTAIDTAVRLVRDGPGEAGRPFSASDARQAWGTTRRCAVPLLEHLQQAGVTHFDGALHRLRDLSG